VHLNLAYRWFCRLGLDDTVPDHSTFSKNRHGRFRQSDAFRHVFEGVVRRCMTEGLVRGEGFAIDDTAYGAAPLLNWMVEEKQIQPHIPVWEKYQSTDGSISSDAFRWDDERDEYRCPQGHPLRREWRAFTKPRTHITKADSVIYRFRQADCKTCPLKSQCCTSTPIRKIARSIYEAARNVACDIAKTDYYGQSRKDRKKVEMLFAHLSASCDSFESRCPY
jgi:hypothetical protein